jgi:hypothetical protein
VVPAAVTWSGGGVTDSWSCGANWVGGAAPGVGDDALFPAATTDVVVDAAVTCADFVVADNAPAVFRVDGDLTITGQARGDAPTFAMNGGVLTYAGSAQWTTDTYRLSAGVTSQQTVRNSGTFSARSTTLSGVELENTGLLTFAPGGTILLAAGASPANSRVASSGTVLVDTGTNASIAGGPGTGGLESSGYVVVYGPDAVLGTPAARLRVLGTPAAFNGGTVRVWDGAVLEVDGAGLTGCGTSFELMRGGARIYADMALTGGSVTAWGNGDGSATTANIDGDVTADGTTFGTGGPAPNRVTVAFGAPHAGGQSDLAVSNCTFLVNFYTGAAGDTAISLWAADGVHAGSGNSAVVARVGTGTPPAGTWLRYLSGAVQFTGSDFSSYTAPAGVIHRLNDSSLQIQLSAGPGWVEQTLDL